LPRVAQRAAEHLGVRLDLELQHHRPRQQSALHLIDMRHRVAGAVGLAGERDQPRIEPAPEHELIDRDAEQPGEDPDRVELRQIAARLVEGIVVHDVLASPLTPPAGPTRLRG
jgi:hypothetical protein